jgi:hypothetical protein
MPPEGLELGLVVDVGVEDPRWNRFVLVRGAKGSLGV